VPDRLVPVADTIELVKLVLAFLLLAAPAAHADDEPPAPKTPFDRGRFALSVGGGTQSALGAQYYVLGVGASYFVLDGLALDTLGVVELGGSPFIAKLSPGVRYLAQPLVGRWPLIPYVGTFYTHWFIGGGYADVNTIGARSGLVYVSGSAVLGLGVAIEHTVSTCMTDCNPIYPDITISFAL
jgi:hypothetical protein